MKLDAGEERLLRNVALQNAAAILRARERAERELVEANRRITGLLESLTDGFLLLDRAYRVVMLNRQAELFLEPLGRARHEILGCTLWELFPFIVGTDSERAYRQAMEDRVTVRFDIGSDLTRRWYNVRIFPTDDGLSVYFQDITHQREMSEELRRQQEWFQVTLASIGDGVIATDIDGHVAFLNPVAECITGWKAVDAVGRPVEQVLRLVDRRHGGAIANPVRAVLAQGEAVELSGDAVLLAHDGREVPIEDSAAPIRSPTGEVAGVVVVFHDVGERRRAEEALRDREERLRAIFEHAAIGIAVADLDGTLIEVNARLGAIVGQEPAELVGRRIAELTHPDDTNVTMAHLGSLREGRLRDVTYEQRFRRRDGTGVWSLTSITAIRDQGGRPQKLIGVIEDISDRKRAERERERLVNVLERSLNEVYVFDTRSLRFEYVNEGARRNLGYSMAEMTRLTPLDLKPRFTEAEFRELIAPLLDGRQRKVVFETVHRRRDGTLYPVEVHLQKVTYAGEEVFLAVVLDITERMRAEGALRHNEEQLRLLYDAAQKEIEERVRVEAALRQAQDELAHHADDLETLVEARTASLRAAMAQLEEFSYSVSHDLRAPIRAIAGYAQVLGEDHGDELGGESRWLLERISASAHHMARLVDDVLTLSRAASVEVRLHPIDVAQCVGRIIEQHPALQAPAASLRVLVGETVVADDALLTQALTNLLTNAVKFVAPGVRPEVVVHAERRDGRVRLMVDDNGIGIRPEHLDKLFGMFQRLPTTAGYEGTGIGLALVRKAVERMGGTVGAEPGSGGSRFWIELPGA